MTTTMMCNICSHFFIINVFFLKLVSYSRLVLEQLHSRSLNQARSFKRKREKKTFWKIFRKLILIWVRQIQSEHHFFSCIEYDQLISNNFIMFHMVYESFCSFSIKYFSLNIELNHENHVSFLASSILLEVYPSSTFWIQEMKRKGRSEWERERERRVVIHFGAINLCRWNVRNRIEKFPNYNNK